jgi:hypothetical protein
MGSASFNCTAPPGGCPATQGFWHFACRWPLVSATIDGIAYNGKASPITMTIGGITYTQAQLLTIMPSGALHSGAYANTISQLVAAVLNLSAGGADNATIDGAVSALNTLFTGVNIFCGSGLCAQTPQFKAQVDAYESILDGYNSAQNLGFTCSEGVGLKPGTCNTGKKN